MVSGSAARNNRGLLDKVDEKGPAQYERYMTTDRLLNVEEAAEYLNIPWSMRDLVKRRKVPFIRLSPRRTRFRQSELEQYLTERAVKAG
jgi:excisionase family DNA binding protein